MLSNTMLDVVLYCLCFCFSCVLLPDIMLLTQCCCVLLPDIILLTQCYCHQGTLVNAMERFRSCMLRICSLLSHLIGFSLTRTPCSSSVFIVCVIVSYYYTMLDGVLTLFLLVLWCPCMMIRLSPSGYPFKYHEEVMYL